MLVGIYAIRNTINGKVYVESIREAAVFLGVHPFNLSKHLKGKHKTCRGEILRFVEKQT